MMTVKCNKLVQAQGNNETGGDDDGPSIIHETSSSRITNLPDDCLILIYEGLRTRDERDSFGLTCRQWLRIQNINHESLWYRYHHDSPYLLPQLSPECFHKVLCKLFTRFQNLKALCLKNLPEITDFVMLQSVFSGSKLQKLCLDHCSKYSDTDLSLMFCWLPRLTFVSLKFTKITDRGLEALAHCCQSLKMVNLSWCFSVTDSGISFLLQNCRELRSLYIFSCSSITGIGFLGCPKTLTHLDAGRCELNLEGIKAIVSGGGIEWLNLNDSAYNFLKVHEGYINTETVMTISKGCPFLKELFLSSCTEVKLEGWEAIGLNCTNLEILDVCWCTNLCDQGLLALSNGCNKLSKLYVNNVNNWSRSAVELFKSKKPDVMQQRTHVPAAAR
ncbi:hypothetical protein MKW92_009216 [Papaver armeniacum]|nr:hypothetical protein MKW92_009216 [Papaver armeniacum]